MQDLIYYGALFLGVMLEGEVALTAAALAAQKDIVNIYAVFGVAFTSTLITDWSLFFAGRITGTKILNRFLKNQEQMSRVSHWMQKYPTLIIFLYRYLYGLRIVTVITMGMTGFPLKKFLPLSVLSIALWTFVFSLSGYFMGELVTRIFSHIENYFVYFVIGIVSGVAIIVVIRKIIRKSLGNKGRGKAN